MSRKHMRLFRIIQIQINTEEMFKRSYLNEVARCILLCLPPSFSSSHPAVCMRAMLTTELERQQENYVTGTMRRDLDLLFIFTESEWVRSGENHTMSSSSTSLPKQIT